MEKRTVFAAAIVLSLFLLIGVFQYRTTKSLVTTLNWITRSVEVIDQTKSVDSAITRAEAAAQDYNLTRDREAAESYRSAIRRPQAALQELLEATGDNHSQQQRIASLGQGLSGALDTLNRLMALPDSPNPSATERADLIRSANRQVAYVVEALREVRAEERRLLHERNQKAQADQQRTLHVALIGTLFGSFVALSGAYMLQRELKERNLTVNSLRELSGRLLHLQDEERRHFARELHDGSAQTLSAIQLRLALLQNCVPSDDPRAQLALSDLSSLAAQCSNELRTLSYLFHPPTLEHVGVASAIREWTGGLAQRSGLEIKVQIPDDLPRLQPETETALFRVTQEALSNVHRHSGSKMSEIRIVIKGKRIILEIADAGKGMPQEALGSPVKLGVGIRGMSERLRLLGGELKVYSSSLGTVVRAELPFELRDTAPDAVALASPEASS